MTRQRQGNLEFVLNEYINWKKDEPKFKKYFTKLVEDRTKNSSHNNEQQSVSTSKFVAPDLL